MWRASRTESSSVAKVRRRYLSLDIIRGVAAFGVFGGHLIGYLPEGSFPLSALASVVVAMGALFQGPGDVHWGVTVFIVLSGFCIHLPVASAPSLPDQRGFWRVYAIRRAIRILPVYWVACALGVLAMATAAGQLDEAGRLAGQIKEFSWIAFLAKLLVLTPLYLVPDTELGNGALRTVASEMWLYSAYPFVLLLLARFGRLGMLSAIAGIYAVSVVFGILGIAALDVIGDSESVPRFLLYWVIGVVAAELFCRFDRRTDIVLAIVYCLLIFAALQVLNHLVEFRGVHAIRVPCLALFAAGAIFLIVSLERTARAEPGSALKWAGRLGEASYTLYAVHLPLIIVSFFLVDPAIARLVAFISILVGTAMVYLLVERPSHYYARAARAGA